MNPTLKIDIVTLFPAMIAGYFGESMLGRAAEAGLVDIRLHNLRDWAEGKHLITDDRPFGGGAGMVLKPEPLFAAIESLKTPHSTVIYLTADGEVLNSALASALSREEHLIFISGHYEGIDERVRQCLVDREVSIGDYVLTNGTLPAAVVADAVSRFVPGVLGESQSLEQDSFSDGLLGAPQWTRPAEFRGMRVPEVLLSGDHGAIESWRRDQRRRRTAQRRPELIQPEFNTATR